jgi:CBS domain-containing protein
MVRKKFDYGAAIDDPKGVFGDPEKVLADPRLDREGKRAILTRWEQDARELAVAEEEGMAGGEQNMLAKVQRALRAVVGGRSIGTGPGTKHGSGVADVPASRRVKMLMRETDETVHIDQHLGEAAGRMQRADLPLLPVVDGDEIVGVVTGAIVERARTGSDDGAAIGKVRDHLSKRFAYCYDTDDAEAALTVMNENGVDFLLVADAENLLVGIVMRDRLVEILGRHNPGGGKPRSLNRRADTPARAAGDKPGRPRAYAAKPRIRTAGS